MSLHSSLKIDRASVTQRSVQTRIERIKELMKKGLWKEETDVIGLPKTKIVRIKAKKKIKAEEVMPPLPPRRGAAGKPAEEAKAAAKPAAGAKNDRTQNRANDEGSIPSLKRGIPTQCLINLHVCSSVFLIFAFIKPGFADEHFPFLAEVSKESVNVRAGPNTNFEKIDKLNKGPKVVVLGRSYEWFKVQPLSTTKAYIRSDYLKINEGGDIAVVMGDNVNVRCQASSDAASLGEVKKGTLVKVLG